MIYVNHLLLALLALTIFETYKSLVPLASTTFAFRNTRIGVQFYRSMVFISIQTQICSRWTIERWGKNTKIWKGDWWPILSDLWNIITALRFSLPCKHKHWRFFWNLLLKNTLPSRPTDSTHSISPNFRFLDPISTFFYHDGVVCSFYFLQLFYLQCRSVRS